ncbi:MAG: hypothetical protein VX438_06985, partial [Planctomycetota bacterium]|nr:hypothetical protein [Planctomycetota bacterium]
NPGEISIQLNGWKLRSDQENLSEDSLLRNVSVAPTFFLGNSQRKVIEFSLESSKPFGKKEIRLPWIKGLDFGGIELVVRCQEGVDAMVERVLNPGFEWNSGFDVETVSSDKEVVLVSRTPQPGSVQLTVKESETLCRGQQEIFLYETQGTFSQKFTCSLESSRPFDTCALQTPGGILESVQIGGKSVDLSKMVPGEPTVLELPGLVGKVVLEIKVNLGQLDSNKNQFDLPVYYLPTHSRRSAAAQESIEIAGRSFGRFSVKTQLAIYTASGTVLKPGSQWFPLETKIEQLGTYYEGNDAQYLELSKSIETENEIQVTKAWCHSELNSQARQDRVVVRFVPNRSVITWQIPENAKLVACKLNGKRVLPRLSGGRTEIKTAFDDFVSEQLVEFEFRYLRSVNENRFGLKLPNTSRVLWPKKLLWSIELPDNQYVLNYSDSLSASYVLAWTGFFLQPTPDLSNSQIERWIGLGRDSVNSVQNNDYLFASFGLSDEEHVYVISKRNLVLVFGLFFVTLGCAFVSLRFMRNSLLLVTIAAGILIFGIWYPIWFVQLLQIELFVGFLFGLGFIVSRVTGWFYPVADETRIETNVPSMVLAAPDSGVGQSTRSQAQPRIPPEDL